jgi:hypothetical protein
LLRTIRTVFSHTLVDTIATVYILNFCPIAR